MKRNGVLWAVMLGAMALALVGVLRESNTTKALMPLPVTPFRAADNLLISSTQLGQPYHQKAWSDVAVGTRTGQGQSFTSGTEGPADIDVGNGVKLGDFCTVTDINCDGGLDIVSDSTSTDYPTECPATGPGDVQEPYVTASTDLVATGSKWMVNAAGPYPIVSYVHGDIDTLWLGGGPAKVTLNPPLGLHILSMVLPWTDDTALTTVWTGGEPAKVNSMTCTDSPSNGQSTFGEWGTTPPFLGQNKYPEGDSGGYCGTCADKQIRGFWTDPANTSDDPATVTVTARVVNTGNATGTFKDVWEAEAPANVSVDWANTITQKHWDGTAWVTDTAPTPVEDGVELSFSESLAPAASVEYTGSITLDCLASGDYLVTLKNAAFPTGATKDNDLSSNAAVTVVRLKCAGSVPEVDKQVVALEPTLTAVTGTNLNLTLPQTGVHVQLLVGETATVQLSDLTRNQPAASDTTNPAVDSTQWLVAEAPDLNDDGEYDITPHWSTTLTVDKEGGGAPSATGVTCIDHSVLQPCTGLTFNMNEPAGPQIRVRANLDITCDTAGTYFVPVKAVDMPTGGYGDFNTNNNAKLAPITVYCFDTTGDWDTAKDLTDDAANVYPRWSTVTSTNDYRKSGSTPRDSGLPSDTQFVERLVEANCFWLDGDGTSGGGDGMISPDESKADDDYLAAMDSDNDCLIDAAYAQPGRPIDPNDEPAGVLCDPIIYNMDDPSALLREVAYDKNADSDCDGLLDGIEVAWGSNPLLVDSDSDGATDFQEMFMYTNPSDPDTDGDGFLDLPANIYGDNTDASMDNCPAVYNPTQVNSDGHRRNAGAQIPTGVASNPNQDKIGDACDPDDDNDTLTDVAEAVAPATNPLVFDSDCISYSGTNQCDGVGDYVELMLGKDPLDAASKPTWNLDIQTYHHGCHINVPPNGVWTAWDDEYDGVDNGVENDPDGDGMACNVGGGDPDSDNGFGTGAVAKTEVIDIIEAWGYGTGVTNQDTDGDGCADWVEINDVDGSRVVNSIDQLLIAKRAAGMFTGDLNSDKAFDVTKDGKINSIDVLLVAKNQCSLKPWGGCTPKCGPEN